MTLNSQFVSHFFEKLEKSAFAKMDRSLFDSFEVFKSSESYFNLIIEKFIKVFEKMQDDEEIAYLSGEVYERFIDEYICKCKHLSVINK